jgi:hypothetical protein
MTGGAPPAAHSPIPQHRCAGCGCIGRLSLADPDPTDPRPVLRLVWPATGGCRLLCALCRDGGGA